MANILVIGNCTARGIGNCIRALRPGDNVASYFLEQEFDLDVGNTARGWTGLLLQSLSRNAPRALRRHLGLPKRTIENLSRTEFDYAFVSAHLDGKDVLQYVRTRRPVIYWPNLVFVGYHPDCTYLAADGKAVRTPMGDYNSRIAATAYAADLSVHDATRLFNKLVYARLGYFQRFALSKATLARDFDRYGYDLASDIAEWMAPGPFMYSINHPKLVVCASIAKQALRKAELDFDDIDPTATVPDNLALMGNWPVYPEIAEGLGVPGSTIFSSPTRGQQAARLMTLSEFIEGSFERYRDDGFDRGSFARQEGLSALVKSIGL